MDKIKEQLLEIIKTVADKCSAISCSNCEYCGLEDCSKHWTADAIMDKFAIVEKLQAETLKDEDVNEIKQRLNSIYGKSSIESMPKRITDVILAEDGSVDEDELKKQFGDNVPIIIYRQGAVKPEIQHLEEPITVVCENESSQTDESNKEHELLKKIIENCDLSFEYSPEYDGTNCKIDSEIILSDDEVKMINSFNKEQLEEQTNE